MTHTITMNGNSTGYGSSSGSEMFTLAGYYNTVLLAGANDTLTITSGQYDSIDLNSTGFTNSVTDVIDLGASAFNTITASHALSQSSIGITATSGSNSVSLVNHGGSTHVALGYSGNAGLQSGLGITNAVTLNGDASNSVALTAGGRAAIAIGSAGDGITGYASSVSLTGPQNTLTGGDENFTVSNTRGGGNRITLGNGHDTLMLTGPHNHIVLGNGDNTVAFGGLLNRATFGTGSNLVTSNGGTNTLFFAAGGAGSTETLQLAAGTDRVDGGDENFVVTNTSHFGAQLNARLGNGNNSIDFVNGRALMTIGASVSNTGTNTVTLGKGGNHLEFKGGTDTINLTDAYGAKGFDTVLLKGTMLGTSLTAQGAFETITLQNDANAVITQGTHGQMSLTLDGDSQGGFGTIVVNGFTTADVTRIHLIDASPYTIHVDNTPAGGITLEFSHGSVDLVGVQALPNNFT